MAHPGAYSRSDQALLGMSGDEFRKPTELCGAETGSRAPVDSESGTKDQGGGQPAPRRGVKPQVSPGCGTRARQEPRSDPERYQEAIRRIPPCAPIVGAGMDEQPECWDGGVHDARQPPDSAEKYQHAADYSDLLPAWGPSPDSETSGGQSSSAVRKARPRWLRKNAINQLSGRARLQSGR